MDVTILSSDLESKTQEKATFADPLIALHHDLRCELDIVDSLIRQRADSELVGRIADIADHLFQAGGKRIRPILTVAMARLFGVEGQNHLNLAAAIEFIHTTTLLHDDVVDQSRQRRGRPTANLLWDNKSSILVGDFFFARAFQLMVATHSIESLLVLADSSATIAEAEVLQLARLHDIDVSEDVYFHIIDGKTACLFAAAARVGALIAGASDEECQAAKRFGHALGISYQIRDDVLDFCGSSQSLGKNIGDDLRDRKMTLPLIRAVQTASDDERKFWKRVIAKGKQNGQDLEQAVDILHRRGILDRVQEEAITWSESAKRELMTLPEHPLRDRLEWLAGFAATRKS